MRLSETTKARRAGGTGGNGRHAPNTNQTRDDDSVSTSEVTALRTRKDVPRKVREPALVPLHAEATEDDPRTRHLKISLELSRFILHGCLQG